MPKNTNPYEQKKISYSSPLVKATQMEQEDDASSKLRAKYTNIKNEINYDTSSISSTYKGCTLEKGSVSQISAINRDDTKGNNWTTITPKSEAYIDWDNCNDNIFKVDSQGSSAVELVVAVKSAIQQRQDILEEWKKKAETSVNELQQVKQGKSQLESTIGKKEKMITQLTKELSEIQTQLTTLHNESSTLKRNYDSTRMEKEKINSLYHCALQELSEARKKLTFSEEQRDKLERRFRIQEEENEHWFKKGEHIEHELANSKNVIATLKAEIVELEEKLATLQAQLIGKTAEHKEDDGAIEELKNKLTHSLEELKKEIQRNRANTTEINKMTQLIETLEKDKATIKKLLNEAEEQKNSFQSQNSSLQSELRGWKQKYNDMQQTCDELQKSVKALEKKLKDFELENSQLKKKLTNSLTENNSLQEELDKTDESLKKSQSELLKVQIDLEKQKTLLTDANTNIKMLQSEKQSITKQLKILEDMEKKRQNELTRLLADNKSLKQNIDSVKNELTCKSDQLCKAQREAKTFKQQLKCVESDLIEEKSRHNEELFALQEKAKASNDYWKNYVEKEIGQIKQTYMEKLHRHCEEYSSVMAQSNSREASFFSEPPVPTELVDEIGYLKKQLNDSTKKLEEAILQAETSRKQIYERSNIEQQQMIEKLNPAKKMDSTYISELENRIQTIMTNFIGENNALQLLESENRALKEKLEKLKKKCDENKNLDMTTNELIAERDQLRIDLGHSKNLTSLAEEAIDRLKQDLADGKRKLEERTEAMESLKNEQLALKKNIGSKDAQINLLSQSIENLKKQIGEYNKGNENVRVLKENLEHDKLIYDKDIFLLKNEINELRVSLDHSKTSKKDVCALNDKINQELYELRAEIKAKTNEVANQQSNVNSLQQQLHSSQSEILDLKNKLKETAPKDSVDNNFKELMEKFVEANKKINKLQQQILQLNHNTKNLENMHQTQLKTTEDEKKSILAQVDHLNDLVKSEDTKNKRLTECLNSTDGILTELIRIFDNHGQSIMETLKIPIERLYEPFSVNHNECLETCYYSNKQEFVLICEGAIEKMKVIIKELVEREGRLSTQLAEQQEQQQMFEMTSEKRLHSQKSQIEQFQKIVQAKQDEFDKIHQQLIDIQLVQSSQSDDLSKSISEHLEKQRSAMSQSEENKNSIKTELFNVNKRMQNLITEKRELEIKLQEIESVCSMYNIKIVTLEGEIENLTLKLKDSNERDIEQNDLISKITTNNRELTDQLMKYKIEIQKLQNVIAEKEQDVLLKDQGDTNNDGDPKHCCKQNKCAHLHSSIAEVELQKKLLQERLEAAQKSEHMSRLNMVSMEDKIKSLNTQLDSIQLEKASLEGWVHHLQKMLQENNNMVPPKESIATASRNEKQMNNEEIIQYKGRIKQLEIDNSHLKKKLDQLNLQLNSIQLNKSLNDQHKLIAERDEYEKKYGQVKKQYDEKEVEISNLKSEINAIKMRYLRKSEPSRSTADETIQTGSDLSLDKRVTACVVTYSHKSDSKNSSFGARDSPKTPTQYHQIEQTKMKNTFPKSELQKTLQQQDSTDFKCDECTSKYEYDSSLDLTSQKMMHISASNVAIVPQIQPFSSKDSQSVDNSKEKKSKKKFSWRKKTII